MIFNIPDGVEKLYKLDSDFIYFESEGKLFYMLESGLYDGLDIGEGSLIESDIDEALFNHSLRFCFPIVQTISGRRVVMAYMVNISEPTTIDLIVYKVL